MLSVQNAVALILRIPVTIIIGNAIVVDIVLQLWIFSIKKYNVRFLIMGILQFLLKSTSDFITHFAFWWSIVTVCSLRLFLQMITMQIHYALYDPSHDTGGGNYWTWYAETLPLEMLQGFYREVAVKHVPKSPFDMADPHYWDDFTPTTDCYEDWTVIYRFFSGGNDKSNRPGRYIILTAWIKTEETNDVDLSPIQDNNLFRFVSKNARKLPVSLPKVLTEKWEIETPKPETANDANSPSKASDIISIALLSFLLGMWIGAVAGVVLQYYRPILPLTLQEENSNDTPMLSNDPPEEINDTTTPTNELPDETNDTPTLPDDSPDETNDSPKIPNDPPDETNDTRPVN